MKHLGLVERQTQSAEHGVGKVCLRPNRHPSIRGRWQFRLVFSSELDFDETEVFHTSTYPQLAYTQTLLHETHDTKKGQLSAEGWLTDSIVGKDPGEATGAHAAAVTERKEIIEESRVVQMVMRPFTPFRVSGKRIPPEWQSVSC